MYSCYHSTSQEICPGLCFVVLHSESLSVNVNHIIQGYFTGTIGVTKPISSIPLFSLIFSTVKTHVSYWKSRLYLTGVTAAQLWFKDTEKLTNRASVNPDPWGDHMMAPVLVKQSSMIWTKVYESRWTDITNTTKQSTTEHVNNPSLFNILHNNCVIWYKWEGVSLKLHITQLFMHLISHIMQFNGRKWINDDWAIASYHLHPNCNQL